MKIYLEVLIVFILMIIFILWRLWFLFSRRRLNKKYKPENDKARKGGEDLEQLKEQNQVQQQQLKILSD